MLTRLQIHSKRDTELTKLHTSLVELHKSMNTEISTEFLEVGTKLTLQRISEFKAVLAEQQSEVRCTLPLNAHYAARSA